MGHATSQQRSRTTGGDQSQPVRVQAACDGALSNSKSNLSFGQGQHVKRDGGQRLSPGYGKGILKGLLG